MQAGRWQSTLPHLWFNNEKNKDTRSDCLSYWTTFYNIAFYTGTLPFRFKWNQENENEAWELCTNKFQNAIFKSLTFVYIFNYLITSIYGEYGNPTDPLFYFNVSKVVVGTLYFGLHYVGWTKRDNIKEIYDSVQAQYSFTMKPKPNLVKTKPRGNGFWILACLFLSQLFLYLAELLAIRQWSFSNYINEIEEWVIEALPGHHPNSRYMTLAFAVLMILMDCYYMLAGYSLEFLFFSTTLFLRSLINETLQGIRQFDLIGQTGSRDCETVLNKYRSLKKLSCNINQIIAPVTWCFVFGSLVWICHYLIRITSTSNPLNFTRIGMFVVYVALMLYVAADTHKMTGGIYKWLYLKRNYRGMPQMELISFLHDLALNDIGIGVESCFVVSFQFLGLLLGLVISYALIFYQLQALKQI